MSNSNKIIEFTVKKKEITKVEVNKIINLSS